MALKNYTTKVPAHQSVAEIQDMLQKHGASAILFDYEKGTGRIASLSFKIEMSGQSVYFKLPLKWREAGKVMANQGINRANGDEDYVYRVAWRIMRDWVDVQMALVDIELVQLQEVFLPYAITKSGKTLYENMLDNPQILLN